jgi:hypothetical protein
MKSQMCSILVECTATFERNCKRNLRKQSYIDEVLIDPDDYKLINGTYIWYKEDDFPTGSHAICVSYTAGMDGRGYDVLSEGDPFNDVDPSLESIILEDAQLQCEKRKDLGIGRMGVSMVTRGGRGAMSMESVQYETYVTGFTSRYNQMVRKFREYRMAM